MEDKFILLAWMLLSIIHDLILYYKNLFISIILHVLYRYSIILRLCVILGMMFKSALFFSLSSPILSDSYVTFFHIKAFVGFETNNRYKICNSMGQQVYFAAEGMFNKSNNILMSSLGPGSPLWEKGANISVGYRSSRFTRQYFSYLTPFFAFFPHCAAWFQLAT